MGGKRQKFPNIGWLVKLQSFKVMRHNLNSILAEYVYVYSLVDHLTLQLHKE